VIEWLTSLSDAPSLKPQREEDQQQEQAIAVAPGRQAVLGERAT
jgi:hypothetical protein